MNRSIASRSFHPAVLLLYFASVVILSMCVTAPVYLGVDLAASIAFYLVLSGRAGVRRVLGSLALILAIAVVVPLFNPRGSIVLFEYLGGRIYTLQALCEGLAMGTMLVSMLLWFASLNIVMTSEGITFLFGKMAPALSLVFTMILRLVPEYEKKLHRFAAARACIGKSASDGTVKHRIKAAGILVSMTLTWAFESGIRTADSMRCRGYGLAGRTSYSVFRFDARDAVALIVTIPLIAASSLAVASGEAKMAYLPEFTDPAWGSAGIGIAAFTLLVLLPSLFELGDRWLWRSSLSKI